VATKTNTEFEFMGINHLAPTCRDMKETVDFYSGVLGMPLICTTAAGPTDQVFFFDAGNGTTLAFMWSPDYPPAAPGVASPANFLEDGYLARAPGNTATDVAEEQPPVTKGTAVGALNHIALNVAPEKIEEYREKLLAKGIKVSPVVSHAQDPSDPTCQYRTPEGLDDPKLFMRSIYFHDPNGIQLEIACWCRAMTDAEAALEPASATDQRLADPALATT
jgi:catechol 2,3-dioxygenase-like lactoylglutathione lyase family enzyme